MRRRPQAAGAAKALVQYHSEAQKEAKAPTKTAAAQEQKTPEKGSRPTSPSPKSKAGAKASPAVSKASPQPSPAKPGRASEQVKSPRSRTPEAKSPPATPRRPESAKKTASKAPSPERPTSARPSPSSEAKAAKATSASRTASPSATPKAKAPAPKAESKALPKAPAKVAKPKGEVTPPAKAASPPRAKETPVRSSQAVEASPKATTPRGKIQSKAEPPVPTPVPAAPRKPHVPRVATLVKPKAAPKEEEPVPQPKFKAKPAPRSMYPATPRHPLSARKSPSKPSTQPSETSSTGGEIAAAAAAAASSRIVRVTSNYSEDEMAGNNDEASEGESKEERPTIREHSERSVRKSASEGMNTLREGDIQELATSEPMPEDAAQTWQNRWRRQSMEDPEAPIEAAPVESRGSWARSSCGGVLDAGQRPSADGLELASDVKLVSIPDIAPEVPQVPVLPAPGEARRPQEVHRESIGGQSVEGTRSRHESFEEPSGTEEMKEVPQLPTPVESTASSRRKTIVGVPGEVLSKDVKEKLVAMVTPPEGPRIEARIEESQVTRTETQKTEVEAKPQSPERHMEDFQGASPSKESPKRSKLKSRSRSTSFNDAEEKRAIRAEGLQELLQEVYDKFRRCSAQLRESDLQRSKVQAPHSNAGAEDTDLADTWQEVEWLRQAVVGMHSHLLLAQKRQNVLEKRCKDFQERISEVRSQGAAPDSTLLAPRAPVEKIEKEEPPQAVYTPPVPLSSALTSRGRGPVTTYVHPPAQLRAASAPQVSMGRMVMPTSYASAVSLSPHPSPRGQVFQEMSPSMRRQGPQAFVPVHAASPAKLPLAPRRIQITSMEGSPVFMPSPRNAANPFPAQGVRAWLPSPMPSMSAPVTPVATPLATPLATPAATPPMPGPGLPGLLYGSTPSAAFMPNPQLTGSWSVPHPMRFMTEGRQLPPSLPLPASSTRTGHFGLSQSIG